ncbi:AAI domain-containing protein [Citrus sinensis]|uniref:AAI domain-containing protein n=1 Tax=Citrus sinensis TaxID=2711 RepID=A0ACB8IRH6_CITSI|nr:AAI domain-containing protein [Citrus sinensis]
MCVVVDDDDGWQSEKGEWGGGGGGLSPSQCSEERRLGVNACKPIVYGQPPSPACCQRIRVSHIECVCPAITPKLAAFINVNRVIRLIEGCGRRVSRHFKCGSITTP